jgi:excisionase family DNA binding protein
MSNRKYEIPNGDEVDIARASAAVLTKLLQDLPNDHRASIRMGGQDLIVPRQAVELLKDILAGMSAGKIINIVPMAMELTTQQAADFLNVSRPYLIGLLEQGVLNHTLVGTHRRVRFDDLLVYKEKMASNSKAAMDELMKLSQELGIGY